jgi:hypothetical protein
VVATGCGVATVMLQNASDGDASFSVKEPFLHGKHVLES